MEKDNTPVMEKDNAPVMEKDNIPVMKLFYCKEKNDHRRFKCEVF